MSRPLAAAVVVVLGATLLATACDATSDTSSDTRTPASAKQTLEERWRAPGEDVAVVAGTSDHAVGPNRISFLIVDRQSKLVEQPTARVWVARGLKQVPFQTAVARFERIGVPGGDTADADGIYVARVVTPTVGRYWFMAEPVGGTRIQALGNIVVRKRSLAPAVGDHAIPSRTPTLRSTNGELGALTTARHPDRSLYQVSVAEAIDAHEPFVLAFATPQFCQSRACGPVVDVVSAVGKLRSSKGVRFIHVEIYSDNDPAKGVNRWIKQWRLPTEPFTFVVDRKGIIRTKLEGAFSSSELERAVAAVRKR